MGENTSHSNLSIDTKQLLRHTKWARSLARQLVGPSAADDLVQDTWLAALERPPVENRPLRPWLRGVLGKLALQRSRRRGRRAARERDASRAEALPSAATLTERAESQRILMTALLGLEAGKRELLMLRFVEDHSAASIGRKLNIPVSTIKSRIQAALSSLRDALDDDFEGSSRTWGVALLPLISIENPIGPGKSVVGPVLAKLSSISGPQLLAVCALLIGLLILDPTGSIWPTDPAPTAVRDELGPWAIAQVLQPTTSRDLLPGNTPRASRSSVTERAQFSFQAPGGLPLMGLTVLMKWDAQQQGAPVVLDLTGRGTFEYPVDQDLSFGAENFAWTDLSSASLAAESASTPITLIPLQPMLLATVGPIPSEDDLQTVDINVSQFTAEGGGWLTGLGERTPHKTQFIGERALRYFPIQANTAYGLSFRSRRIAHASPTKCLGVVGDVVHLPLDIDDLCTVEVEIQGIPREALGSLFAQVKPIRDQGGRLDGPFQPGISFYLPDSERFRIRGISREADQLSITLWLPDLGAARLINADTGSAMLPPCSGTPLRLRTEFDLVGLCALNEQGEPIDRLSKVSIGSQKAEHWTAHGGGIYLAEKSEFEAAQFVEFNIMDLGSARFTPDQAVQLRADLYGFPFGSTTDRPTGSIRVVPTHEEASPIAQLASRRPELIALPSQGDRASRTRPPHTEWIDDECEITDLLPGVYDVYWVRDWQPSQVFATSVSVRGNEETRLEIPIPTLVTLPGQVQDWEALPFALRPTVLNLDGNSADVGEAGEFEIEVNLPWPQDTRLDGSWHHTGHAWISSGSEARLEQGRVVVRLLLDELDVAEFNLIDPAAGQLELWFTPKPDLRDTLQSGGTRRYLDANHTAHFEVAHHQSEHLYGWVIDKSTYPYVFRGWLGDLTQADGMRFHLPGREVELMIQIEDFPASASLDLMLESGPLPTWPIPAMASIGSFSNGGQSRLWLPEGTVAIRLSHAGVERSWKVVDSDLRLELH
jgi:RNA polymerase sigma-70 factor (ECF subfamily)